MGMPARVLNTLSSSAIGRPRYLGGVGKGHYFWLISDDGRLHREHDRVPILLQRHL